MTEIIIDAWVIDKSTREYADASIYFYTEEEVTVEEIFEYWENMGFKLQRKATGLDRIQISGRHFFPPEGVRAVPSWVSYLNQRFNVLNWAAPKSTGHHRRLTPEERALRIARREEKHRTIQERLDLL
jgi:hypothetical protein